MTQTTNKAQLICVEGYWNDQPSERFENRCVVLPKDATDDERYMFVDEYDGIFYVFEHDEPIVGKHLDFTVTFYTPLRQIG